MSLTTEDHATLSAADLRAMRARKQRTLYELAADVKIHPSRLGGYFNGTLALTPDIAARIAAALTEGE
jgi:plasmid maintenance system antidote protein VapI